MLKSLYSLFIVFAVFLFSVSPFVTVASGQESFKLVPPDSGVKVTDDQGKRVDSGKLVESIVRNVITLFFTVAAVAFVIMILWGATEWILSGGDKEKVAGARKRITTAIIGIVILALAFVIIDIVGQVTGLELQNGLRIPNLVSP